MIRRIVLAFAMLAALAAPAMAERCPAGGAEAEIPGSLPRFARALASGGPIEVLTVGLGSMRAGGVEGPFAQAFREAMERGLPGRQLEIIAVPTPGMVARDAADRLRRGVAEGSPTLVVWRTGLSDALAVTDPARFQRTVQRAAAWISAQNADLVLVDLAYTGAGGYEPTYRRYVDALAQVGRVGEATVFRRHAIMEAWHRAGVLPQMAVSEACLAEILAAAILRRAAP